MKRNCWEFMGCERQPGGKNVKQFGVCPASTEEKLNGVHGGKNAGRACWVVAGTFCDGRVQGTFAVKYRDCEICGFYKTVRAEEKEKFELSVVLHNKLGYGIKVRG